MGEHTKIHWPAMGNLENTADFPREDNTYGHKARDATMDKAILHCRQNLHAYLTERERSSLLHCTPAHTHTCVCAPKFCKLT